MSVVSEVESSFRNRSLPSKTPLLQLDYGSELPHESVSVEVQPQAVRQVGGTLSKAIGCVLSWH